MVRHIFTKWCPIVTLHVRVHLMYVQTAQDSFNPLKAPDNLNFGGNIPSRDCDMAKNVILQGHLSQSTISFTTIRHPIHVSIHLKFRCDLISSFSGEVEKRLVAA